MTRLATLQPQLSDVRIPGRAVPMARAGAGGGC